LHLFPLIGFFCKVSTDVKSFRKREYHEQKLGAIDDGVQIENLFNVNKYVRTPRKIILTHRQPLNNESANGSKTKEQLRTLCLNQETTNERPEIWSRQSSGSLKASLSLRKTLLTQ
jgi:hypothetical protein